MFSTLTAMTGPFTTCPPVSGSVAFGLVDTLLLVVLAVPLGFALAWAWTRALAHSQLAPGIPVAVTAGAWWAALGAGAGAVVAAAGASARTLRRPVVEQWRRATRRVRARSWVVDAAVGVVHHPGRDVGQPGVRLIGGAEQAVERLPVNEAAAKLKTAK